MRRCAIVVVVVASCCGELSLGFSPSSPVPALHPRRHGRILQYSNAMLEEQKEELKSRLPPIRRRTLSKYEKEFRELLEAMLFTPQEMSSITDPRMRAIYEGVAASYYVPEVYRAFEVLYEDYLPLRLAGRVIHSKLQKIMDESKEYQLNQLETTASKTGFLMGDLLQCWISFVERTGSRELPVDRVELLFCSDLDSELISSPNEDIMTIINPKGKKSLSFTEIIDGYVALQPAATANELQGLFLSVGEGVSGGNLLDDKRRKYAERYDEMLVKFAEWKEFIPSGEGRRIDILRGCFVGSENKPVVEALRVIYTDYSALRMSGDWIFQVVSALMNGVMRRRHHHRQQKTP